MSLAESVVAERLLARVAVVRACIEHPLAPVPNLTLALSSMAVVLEREWLSEALPAQKQLLEVYRTTIALSADLAVLDIANSSCKTCGDLLAYWEETNDAFFVVTMPQ